MPANPEKARLTWWKNFEALSEFLAQNHRRPTQRERFTFEGEDLPIGKWLMHQRQRPERLDAKQAAALAELLEGTAMTRDEDWELQRHRYETYYLEHGHTPARDVDVDGSRPGQWAADQRKARARGQLSAARVARLESTSGWAWSAAKLVAAEPTRPTPPLAAPESSPTSPGARRTAPKDRSQRWPTIDEARLLALLLDGASIPQVAEALGRSQVSVSSHLSKLRWPTPVELRKNPALAEHLFVAVSREPVPEPFPENHKRRRLPESLSDLTVGDFRELTTAEMDALKALPPVPRMREWARLMGLPIADRSGIPEVIAELYARFAPPELQTVADPATERHAAHKWALRHHVPIGARGRLPGDVLEAFRAAGSPGLAEEVAVASQVHIRSDRSGGLVVRDPDGIRHRVDAIGGVSVYTTFCGVRGDERWTTEAGIKWAGAGVRRCAVCREDVS